MYNCVHNWPHIKDPCPSCQVLSPSIGAAGGATGAVNWTKDVDSLFIDIMKMLSSIKPEDRKRILLALWEFYGRPEVTGE